MAVFNLTKMEDTYHLTGKASPQTQKLIEEYGEADRFELTHEEVKQLEELIILNDKCKIQRLSTFPTLFPTLFAL